MSRSVGIQRRGGWRGCGWRAIAASAWLRSSGGGALWCGKACWGELLDEVSVT